ncbi:MAG TPA: leucine-rich repeat domain-containing protein [Negativicutes bacterium]|nr:leucine-rich repeat domain-containing protein [Negativicutes bacterium]
MTRTIITVFIISFAFLPASASAEGDYEEGDGWIFQDGTLTITENGGLKDFSSNDQDEQTGVWKYQHSAREVDVLAIGKNVTELSIEVCGWSRFAPSNITIEPGNTCFIIDNGWVVNKKTNTLFSASNLSSKESIESIENIPAYIEHIGARAFYDYGYTRHVTIPQSVVSIGDYAFDSCKTLQSVFFPRDLQSIGTSAFYGCQSLEKIQLGPEVNDIGIYTFDWCPALSSVDIRETKIEVLRDSSIGAGDQLKSLELPDTVKHIEARAIDICTGLETILIHSDGIIVDNSAFRFCDNLKRIIFTAGKPSDWGRYLFEETGRSADGKGYISSSHAHGGEIIPYPTLYYTAAYASEWAPNGETEWNGYPIQQISQEELEALLAEARGEAAPGSVTLSPAPTQPPTPTPASTSQPDAISADASALDGWMLAATVAAVVAVGVIVFSLVRKKKD